MKFPQKIPIYIFSRGGLGCMIFFCIKFDPFQALLNLYGSFGNMYIHHLTNGGCQTVLRNPSVMGVPPRVFDTLPKTILRPPVSIFLSFHEPQPRRHNLGERKADKMCFFFVD